MTEAAPAPEQQIRTNKEAAIAELVSTIIESLTTHPEEWRFNSGMGDGYATHVSEVIIAIDGSKIIRPPLSHDMSVRAMNNLCSAIETAQAKQGTLALTTCPTILQPVEEQPGNPLSDDVIRIWKSAVDRATSVKVSVGD